MNISNQTTDKRIKDSLELSDLEVWIAVITIENGQLPLETLHDELSHVVGAISNARVTKAVNKVIDSGYCELVLSDDDFDNFYPALVFNRQMKEHLRSFVGQYGSFAINDQLISRGFLTLQ